MGMQNLAAGRHTGSFALLGPNALLFRRTLSINLAAATDSTVSTTATGRDELAVQLVELVAGGLGAD